ncbi:hypothetical protein ZYGR_0AI00350 [Zygosaccharomyces rouxii]|uniref:Mto1-like Mto2p-binding domain-containing protein n=1 Tax=Zygosaccharomyces rouxii TaxID=4956 RepID=A0A1Q3AB04_ZYGRO|nr:hypothetical protein ZYGR_0AI00350 [Zygosaccharomyces rouxii]
MDSVEIQTRLTTKSRSNSNDLTYQPKSDAELKLPRDSSDVEDNYDNDETSEFTLPQLKDSMTPWRATDKPLANKKHSTSPDVASPINSRPATRNSLFSVDGAYTVTSSSASSEVDNLQRQLTIYKLKVKALLELIKQFNYTADDAENGVEDDSNGFYQRLISTIAQNDDVEELKTQMHDLEMGSDMKTETIRDLKEQLIEMENRWKQTKEEHAETLEYANEYIGLNEQITTCIDEMLNLLMENLELSPEEMKTLQDARDTSSEFAMAKMNALSVTLGKILRDLHEKRKLENDTVAAIANSTELEAEGEPSVKNESGNESVMDTQFEIAIEGIHEQYDSFVKSIQAKLDKSAELEKTLAIKLAQQTKILKSIGEEAQHKDQLNLKDSRRRASLFSDISDLGKRASVDLSKSYQEHVDGLNHLVQTLKSSIAEKSWEIGQLKLQLRDQDQLVKREQRSRQNLKTLEDLTRQKEKTWEEFVNNLEESIESFQLEKQDLLEENDKLRSENTKLDETLEKVAQKTETYQEQRNQLNHELRTMTNELMNLKDENSALHKLVFNVENTNKTVHKQKSEFTKFQAHLLLHLENVYKTLSKILQKKSIDQSKRKLEVLHQMNDLSQVRNMQPKLESLYNFIETALESVVESYMMVITAEKDKVHSGRGHEREMQLRIEELERKWVSERERRKLDSNAAEVQISKLEAENEALREKLYNMTIR